MDFKGFKYRVNQLIQRSGGNLKVEFHADMESGKFLADVSDGTCIIGHPGSFKITVKWGSSHLAIASI